VEITFFCYHIIPLLRGHQSGFGGAELELWNVASGLATDSNYKVTIVTVTSDIQGTESIAGVTILPVSPIPPLRKSDPYLYRRWQVLKYLFRLSAQLWQIKSSIYFSKLASMESIVVWIISRLRASRFVFRIEHDWETNTRSVQKHLLGNRRFLRMLYQLMIRNADLVIAQSTDQLRALDENLRIKGQLIRNAHFIPAESTLSGRSSVLWIARCHPMKRPGLFLELARRLPDLQFVMVLAPTHDRTAELFNKIKQEAASISNLQLIPGLPQYEIMQQFERARIFVLTSEAEGYSNVLIEAFKSCTPVISMKFNPENVFQTDPAIDGVVGLVADDDIDRAAEFISIFFQDQKFWQASARKAYNFANQNFGAEAILERYKYEFASLAR
jgi:glycosyltransferase involved in cell wall biosynthesis